ncbi:hypothetical protein CXB51_034191 [Gossypium anomalum]|uniref:Uncharacterized protein n=1 Tax=Gossypium anomalum TaxID=47600 RepID=A0A8J6CH69_9ROSI|nr:hypothetical protein CXB51_034191 [Gossypium anomalum]
MGNNASCKIAGVGTIKVKMFDGVVRTLSDVRYVPELKRNLISLSTLDSKGYRYTAESGVLKISKGSLVVMKGQRNCQVICFAGSTTLLVMQLSLPLPCQMMITKLWHMRLGHMSENGMVELSKRGLLDGQGICKLNFCEHCVFGKQKRVRFTRGIHKTRRKRWSIFILILGTIQSAFERRDRETLVVRHTPQQNGVAERMNRTIMEKKQPLRACFLINRSPSVAIEKKTPQEVWSGNPANYSDLKIFGCPAYAHVNNGKLEPRSIKCVFLGYKAGVKGYKLWCPENRKVVISRDVIFDETAMLPNLSLKDSSNKEIKSRYRCESRAINYSEAISCEDSEKWMFAMQEEMESLHKNKTWDLVKLPKGKKTVRCKWVFKKKKGLQKLKNLNIKQGMLQRVTVKFQEWTQQMFSPPVVKHSSIRALLGIVAMHDLELEQLDVKTAFLHGELEEDIYMHNQRVFTVSEKEIMFNMRSAKPVSTPLASHFRLSSTLSPQSDDEIEYMSHVPYSSAVGSLMYAMVCSRPDLSYAVSAVSRYMTNPGKEHWKAVQWILRYLRGTTDVCLQFGRTEDGVIGYVDADFAGDLDRRRSLTGYVFTIGGCAKLESHFANYSRFVYH